MPDPQTLLHVFPTFAVGGSQMRFAALANCFGGEFRHLVVAMDGRKDCSANLRHDLDICYPQIVLRQRDTLGNVWRFRQFLKSVKPDRLLTYNWGSIECAIANWPGLVAHVHTEDGFGPEEVDEQLMRRVLTRRYALSHSTVVLPSRALCRIASEIWKLDPASLRHIPNGIDCNRFGAHHVTPLGCAGLGPVIGTVAALRPEKNLGRLLQAFRRVRAAMPCRLLIAGDGPERVKLEHAALMLGIAEDVTFAGHIVETERVYKAMSLFALSSDTEQMPTAVLEAMAAGLPVVSTDVGDVAQMVAPENRPYLTPLDVPALAAAMLKLLSGTEATAIGAANRVVVRERYDQEKMFAAYKAVFSGSA